MKTKKAQVFTVIAIALIVLMFASFEIFSYLHQASSIKARVSTMDAFLSSVEENLQRQMYISGFRIIFLVENQITSTGHYVNVDNFFNEAFFNGTVDGAANNSILLGATYSDLINSINDKAKKINVEINLTNSNISVKQDDPWHVKFTLESDFIMNDKENLAKWEKRQIISSEIPITFFTDPVYTVNTYGKISRKIIQTPYEQNYTQGSDVTNLKDHVEKGYYAVNPNAPNFLQRLEGNLTKDPTGNGIEGFVIIPDLTGQGIVAKDKSLIDYIYFSSENPSYQTVSGMQSWFKLDEIDFHPEKYLENVDVSTLIQTEPGTYYPITVQDYNYVLSPANLLDEDMDYATIQYATSSIICPEGNFIAHPTNPSVFCYHELSDITIGGWAVVLMQRKYSNLVNAKIITNASELNLGCSSCASFTSYYVFYTGNSTYDQNAIWQYLGACTLPDNSIQVVCELVVPSGEAINQILVARSGGGDHRPDPAIHSINLEVT